MKKLSLFASVSAAFACAAAPVSFNNWSSANVTLFSLETAEARVGRPLTATSVAGVSRRVHRREYRRAVGAAAVGGAAAGAYFGQPAGAYEPEPAVEAGPEAYGEQAPYGVADPYGAPAPYGVAEPAPAPYGAPPPYGVVRQPLCAPPLRRTSPLWRTSPLRRTTSSLWRTSPLRRRRTSPLWWAGLWLRPRALRGHCDREPCHRKVVQDRTDRLSMVLDAIAANFHVEGARDPDRLRLRQTVATWLPSHFIGGKRKSQLTY